MPIDDILALLTIERDKLNRAIEALGGSTRRRGRPPRAAGLANAPLKKPHLSPAARKRQSKRMKAYWAAKRKEKKG